MMNSAKDQEVLDLLATPGVSARDALAALGYHPEGGPALEAFLDEDLLKPWKDWSGVPAETQAVAGLLVEIQVASERGARALLEVECPSTNSAVGKLGGKYLHQVFEELVVAALLRAPGAKEVCEDLHGFKGELFYVELGDCEHVDGLWRALSVLHGPVNYHLVKAPEELLHSDRFVSEHPECDTPVSEVVEGVARVEAGDDARVLEAVEALWGSRVSFGVEGLFEVARAL
jgi:hypothetical protein